MTFCIIFRISLGNAITLLSVYDALSTIETKIQFLVIFRVTPLYQHQF